MMMGLGVVERVIGIFMGEMGRGVRVALMERFWGLSKSKGGRGRKGSGRGSLKGGGRG